MLIWTQPTVPAEFALGAFPVFILDAPEGLFYGFPVFGIPGFKIGRYHHLEETIDPDVFERDAFTPRDEEVLRAGISRYFPDANGPTLSLASCIFTNTADEHFVIDRLPGTPQVLIVSPCSGHGYKFASVVGEIAADLALEGDSVSTSRCSHSAGCRPVRLLPARPELGQPSPLLHPLAPGGR